MSVSQSLLTYMLVLAAVAVGSYVVLAKRLGQRLRSADSELRGLVPLEVPQARDFTWREFWRFTRLIRNPEAEPARSCVGASFLEITRGAGRIGLERMSDHLDGRPKFVLLSGVSACIADPTTDSDLLQAIAAAMVIRDRFRWRIPRWATRLLFARCGEVEWDNIEPVLGKAALEVALRGAKDFRVWRRLIGVLARSGDWEEVEHYARRYRQFVRSARSALRADVNGTVRAGWFRRASAVEGVMAAEVVANAWMRRGRFDVGWARHWYIPLITRSTNHFLARMSVAKFVCNHLAALPDRDIWETARSIEAGIPPIGPDDYSNFDQVFSPECWPLLRPHLTVWSIVRELDLFATAQHRRRFWAEITGTRGGL